MSLREFFKPNKINLSLFVILLIILYIIKKIIGDLCNYLVVGANLINVFGKIGTCFNFFMIVSVIIIFFISFLVGYLCNKYRKSLGGKL